jgi:hypothetical protein
VSAFAGSLIVLGVVWVYLRANRPNLV